MNKVSIVIVILCLLAFAGCGKPNSEVYTIEIGEVLDVIEFYPPTIAGREHCMLNLSGNKQIITFSRCNELQKGDIIYMKNISGRKNYYYKQYAYKRNYVLYSEWR